MELLVAVDLGATHTRVGLIDSNGTIRNKVTAPTPHEGNTPSIIPAFLKTLIQSLGEDELQQIQGIGISAAGPVDTSKGVLINPPNIPFHHISLTTPLETIFQVPVYLANDCHAGVIGEALYGGVQGKENIAYITISTGIGGGIIANRRLVLGRQGNAAEIGHFSVDTSYNLMCGCGHAGHWEGYASGRFIPSFFRTWCKARGYIPWEASPPSAEDIFTMAREGDARVLEFVDELGRINARGVSNVVVAYDPEVIVFDGSVITRNADLLLPLIDEHIDRFLPPPLLQLTTLDGEAPLLGASVIAQGYETPLGSLRLE